MSFSSAHLRPLEAACITASIVRTSAGGGKGEISNEDSATAAGSLTVALFLFLREVPDKGK